MSQEALESMLAKAAADETFKTAMESAASPEAAVKLANEHGFAVTEEDFSIARGLLSEADLAIVSGGIPFGGPAVPTHVLSECT